MCGVLSCSPLCYWVVSPTSRAPHVAGYASFFMLNSISDNVCPSHLVHHFSYIGHLGCFYLGCSEQCHREHGLPITMMPSATAVTFARLHLEGYSHIYPILGLPQSALPSFLCVTHREVLPNTCLTRLYVFDPR